MSTRRLIAYRHAGGYECIHLAYEGGDAPAELEANWATEPLVNELISGGDVLSLQRGGTMRMTQGAHSSALAHDFEDLMSMKLANEQLVSIFDAVGTVRRDIGTWNAKCGAYEGLEIENDDSCGQWIHLADDEALYQRQALEDEIEEGRLMA